MSSVAFLWVESKLTHANIKVMKARYHYVYQHDHHWCIYVNYIDITWLLLIFYRLIYYLFLWKRGIHPRKIQNIAMKHNWLNITIYNYTDNTYSWKSAYVQTVFHICNESKTIAEHLISIHWLHLQIKIRYFIQWTQNRSLEYACCVVLFLHSAPSVLCFYIRRRYRFIQR